ncbi:MBL fold metallo-hydrolase [Hathewaya histolytica]|uniref:MBL fold metallo-hydrolase n=1 Tax=Hathewaya histolytica TaxID=1498 RepID=UPI003B67B874
MKIKWLGHSSFLIISKNNKKILIDPFDDTIGYEVYKEKADIVLISHHHFDHNCLQYVRGDYVVIDSHGEFLIDDIKIKGFKSYHDKFNGSKRGENTIFKVEVDGITLCHLGDLGHLLTLKEIQTLGNINILLIPVGGNYTIDNKEAYSLCRSIKSNLVIPMHYKTPRLNFELSGIEDFLINFTHSEKIDSNILDIENLQPIRNLENKLFILDY